MVPGFFRLLRLCAVSFAPFLLLAAGIDAFLATTERESVDVRLERMAALLSDLKGDHAEGGERRRLFAAATEAFARTYALDPPAFVALRRSLEDGAGVRRVVALRAAPDGKGSIPFRAAPGDEIKMRTALEKVAAHLHATLAESASSDRVRALERAAAPFVRILFGREVSPAVLALHRGAPFPVRFENRPAHLLWDVCGDPARPHTLLFILVDDERFAEHHGPDAVVRRADAVARGEGIRIALAAAPLPADGRHPDGRGLIPAEDRPPVPAPLSGPLLVRAAARLHALRPLEEDAERILALHATSELGPLLARRRGFRLAVAAASILAVLFVTRLFVRAAGAPAPPRIPLRARLAAAFALAAALPALGLLHLGRLYAADAERAALREAHEEIERKLSSVAEAQTAMQRAIADALAAACARPEVRSGDFARFTAAVETLLAGDPRVRSAFDRLIVISPAGERLLGNDSLPATAVADIRRAAGRNDAAIAFTAKPLLLTMMRDVNDALDGGSAKPQEQGFVRSVFQSASKSASTLSSRGRLTVLAMGDSLSWTYFDVIVDPAERALAGVAVVFDADRAGAEIIRTLVAQNHADAGERVRIGAASPDGRGADHPSADWFCGDLRELVKRAGRSGATEQAPVSRDGRPMVAVAVPLPGSGLPGVSGGVVLAGVLPFGIVSAASDRAVRIFVLLALLSLAAASLVALIVARKFLVPVRLFGEGVDAIARGDFSHRMDIDSPDELGALSATFNRMVAGLEEKERMSRFVSEFVRSEVARGARGGEIGEGREREMTVLFCNIPGFSDLCARHEASEIVELLNRHFAAVSPILQSAGGVIDKFIGDAVMALFSPPEDAGELPGEARAVAAALAIRANLRRFNAERVAAGKFPIDLAIGIHAATVIQGSIGARAERVDLTVIGDGVNVAARLEALAKEGTRTKIFLSEGVARAAAPVAASAPVGEVRLKGKSAPLPVHEATGPAPLERLRPLLVARAPRDRIVALLLVPVCDEAAAPDAAAAALHDPEPLVRIEAMRQIERHADRATAEGTLFPRLAVEEDPRVRASLVAACGRVAPDERLRDLLPFLADPDGRVRANAAEALGRARDGARLAAGIRPLLRDGGARARANAALLLCTLDDPAGLAALLEMARDDRAAMRASGAWGIGEAAGRLAARRGEVIAALHELLEDGDGAVLRQAVRALGRTGERASVARLLALYRRRQDEQLRLAILTAIDEIGSYGLAVAARGGDAG